MELDSIEIPKSVTKLGKACFRGCDNLRYIKLPSRFKAIEDRLEIPYGCEVIYY